MKRTEPTTIYIGADTVTLPAVPYVDAKYRDALNSRTLYPFENDIGIPSLAPTDYIPEHLVAFHDFIPSRGATDGTLHFFIDDYRFEKLWSQPGLWLNRLHGNVPALLSPDFSVFSDWPLAMQLWQVYRNRWIGRLFQEHGFTVIPTVSWSSPADFYYLGLPKRSVLAVATTGIRGRVDGGDFFRAGFMRLKELDPLAVLVYGGLEGIVDYPPFEVVEYPSFLDRNRAVMEGDNRWAVEAEETSRGSGARIASARRTPRADGR